MEPDKLEEGDRILFNDRKVPLEVEEIREDRVLVKGPKGGEYQIYNSDDATLVSRRNTRRYATYCEDLRKVGRWENEGDKWKHSKSDAEVRLERNDAGFWTIETDLEEELDLPMYGFSEKEFAEEEVERILRDYPEG